MGSHTPPGRGSGVSTEGYTAIVSRTFRREKEISTMKPEALFINGVFESVLQEILRIQSVFPDQILYLQPHSSYIMNGLRDDTPTVAEPMQLYASVTTDLAQVHYQAKIVGWDDKRKIPEAKHHILNEIITALQPDEGGLYNLSKTDNGESVNLLYIRRLHRITDPFSIAQLTKTSDGKPLSTARTTAGGWSYVNRAE